MSLSRSFRLAHSVSRVTASSTSLRSLTSLRSFSTSAVAPTSSPSSTVTDSNTIQSLPDGTFKQLLYDGETEILTKDQLKEKQQLIKELTKRLAGPLADENGRVPTGKNRPIAIEVDGPSHFYANSTRYTAYSKLKHRLLTRMGYKVLHVPYFDWRRLRGGREREDYMRNLLQQEPSEWLDPDDEQFYRNGLADAQKRSGEAAKKTAQAGVATAAA